MSVEGVPSIEPKVDVGVTEEVRDRKPEVSAEQKPKADKPENAYERLKAENKASSDGFELKSVWPSIFFAHVRRIGWARTLLGGLIQYLSIPKFIIINLTGIVALYDWLMAPFFNVKKFKFYDYILFDRAIPPLCAFDRFNCQFCGYANGVTKLWGLMLDELANADLECKGSPTLRALVAIYAVLMTILLMFSYITQRILFFFIAAFLGMHREDQLQILGDLIHTNYAGRHGIFLKTLLRMNKAYDITLAMNLEQIECAFCPLRHVQRDPAYLSDHDKYFYERDQVTPMCEKLETVGTVSPYLPYY